MDQNELAELLRVTFLEEMQEHLGHVNDGLMALEKCPPPEEREKIYNVLFRAAHTLKGSSRAVNAGVIEAGCHEFENVLTAVRSQRIDLTPQLFALLFAMADAVEEAGSLLREGQDLSAASLQDLVPQLHQAAAGPSNREKDKSTSDTTAESEQSHTRPAEPHSALEQQLTEQSASDGKPAQKECASQPTDGQAATAAEKQSSVVPAATVRVAAEKLDSLLAKSGELLIARRRVASRTDEVAELRDLVSHWKSQWNVIHKLLRKVEHSSVASANSGCSARPLHLPGRAAAVLTANRDQIRQLEKRLDRLVATIQADGWHLDVTCNALDDEIHQVRMLPFAEACRGLERVVRDIARVCGKQAELKIQGEDVELDRSVLEGLKDPLLHLVRNAVDHGLESAEQRSGQGKAKMGVVTISAALRGTEVEVVVADDGSGIKLESIRQKLRQKHLPEPTDKAGLVRMLFHANFSTASILTDISGRGVGLDVVQSAVENLHGTVDVTFQPGKGTQFIMRVPLTLTTIRNVLVQASGQTYAVATSSVEQLVRFSGDQLGSMGGRNVLLLGSTPIPISTLAEVLEMPLASPTAESEKQLAIILRVGQQRAALIVDEVVAEQEIVVKNLGRRIRRVRHVSGTSLLSSGRIALVLNVANLVRTALETRETWTMAPAADPDATRSVQRLLVVDDSLTTRTLMKSILETAGYDVEVAVDGADAWTRIQHSKPELIVADVDMPNMNGFELTTTIRRSRQFCKLPVILVTARQSDEDKTRGIQAGANSYIVKAKFDQQNLLETIGQLI